nr:MAG TPA: hypothetical protein [Caudoviricetes sp.]
MRYNKTMREGEPRDAKLHRLCTASRLHTLSHFRHASL